MSGKDAAVREAAGGKKSKRSKKLRILALCLAGILLISLALVLIHFLYCPINYLWVKFSNPDIPARRAGELRVHFIDVGQGDAIVAELPDGKTMLIDGGDETHGAKSALLRYANALGIDEFDYVLLTHPDSDHAGGMDDVLRCFGAKKAFIPYSRNYAPGSSYDDFLGALADEGCATEISHTFGAELSESAEYFYYMMFLSPFGPGLAGSYYDIANAEGATDTDVNNASAVMWMEYAGRSILFTGDITSEAEEKLLTDYEVLGADCFRQVCETSWGEKVTLAPALDSLDFLKVAHHGSAYSTSADFLELTSPETAFISVGAGNAYGHPSQETAARLAEAGAEIYRTDELGSVMLTICADGTYTIDYLGRA